MKIPSFKKPTRFLMVVVFGVSLFLSCKKQDNGGGTSTRDTAPDLATTVNATIKGFITDENDSAVRNTMVQVGNTAVTTDNYGYFEALDATVVQSAAVVTVSRPGYFKSIKTFSVTTGKSIFTRIKLIPKTKAGSVNAVAGGIVILNNGMRIVLPANGFVNALNNTAYNGIVNIAAYWIDPTAKDLARVMPGDLRGLNTDNNLRVLSSYGMAVVELTGSDGGLLQIAAGKKATLHFPVPAALAATAPVSIPLWYFDETKGLWKQEGTAAKSGNSYVGDVSHFSFWNCDYPNRFVSFDCTIVNAAGHPLQNANIKISVFNYPYNACYTNTNENGYTGVAVPDSSQLLLEIFGNDSCGSALYSQKFTTLRQSVSLGTITLPAVAGLATVRGVVISCSNAAVTNGDIVVQNGILFNRYKLDSNGAFNFTQLICGSTSNNITIVGEDIANAQQSYAAVYSIAAGDNAIQAIDACVAHQEYVNYTINGVAYKYTSPGDLIQQLVIGGTTNLYWYYVNNELELDFSRPGIALGSAQDLFKFIVPLSQIPYTASFNTVTPIKVSITEFGPVNYYLSGHFSGTIIGPSNLLYNVTCEFRLKRGD